MSEKRPNQEEIDFLMEEEYALQCRLNRVQERLVHLLGPVAVEATERHLHMVPPLPPDEPA